MEQLRRIQMLKAEKERIKKRTTQSIAEIDDWIQSCEIALANLEPKKAEFTIASGIWHQRVFLTEEGRWALQEQSEMMELPAMDYFDTEQEALDEMKRRS